MNYSLIPQIEYLIKWRGYPSSENTWEPRQHLNCARLLAAFDRKWKRQVAAEGQHATYIVEKIVARREHFGIVLKDI